VIFDLCILIGRFSAIRARYVPCVHVLVLVQICDGDLVESDRRRVWIVNRR
jgi:hypothetical protein